MVVWRLVVCLIIFGLSDDSTAQHNNQHLPKQIIKILNKYKLPRDSLSFYIKEYNAAKPLLAVNSDTPRNPASVIKLLTTYAGLDILGPNYRWKTHIYLDGRLNNGTLYGNLIMEGGGDPFLTRETFWHLLFTLRKRGLKNIRGDLLIDNALFEDETGTPADFDNKPYRAYNSFPDATLLNFRAHQFHIVPLGNQVHVYADPPASNLVINNRLRMTSGPCRGKHRRLNFDVSKQKEITVVGFSGHYPKRCGKQSLFRAVLSNNDYIFGVFKALWKTLGGTISGSMSNISVDNDDPFYTVPSRPLSEIITYINKYSNNVMARQLLLTIGREKSDAIGSKKVARQVIDEWLNDIGIAAPELFLDNGSGLSRYSTISAKTLARLLEHALYSPYQPEFFASLPLIGIDGTVKKRLNGKIPPGNARIKTGLIDNVRTMAGYVKSKSDKNYIVVSLQNHSGVQNTVGTLIQDEVLEWLYQK